MDELWQEYRGPLLEYAAHALAAALLVLLGWLAVRLLIGPLQRLLGRSRMDPSVASFLTNSARAAVVVVVLIMVLNRLGVQTASLLTLFGLAGAAIALSLQGSLANFASGLILLAFRLLRVGDWIEFGDTQGRVTEMLPFHVILVTADNQRVTVPNSLLANGTVRNHSALPRLRVRWTFSLTPQDDLTAAKETLRARLAADNRVLSDEPPQIFVQEWTPERRVLAVQTWTATADAAAVREQLLEQLGEALEAVRRR